MSQIDKLFDINMVLMSLFSSLEAIRDEKNIELIYDIDATIPKELKGDPEALLHLLTEVLTFVFENSQKKEIVLSLLAPEDFLYEESISFEIREIEINEVKIVGFLKNSLNKNLALLNGEVIHENQNPSDVHISIPFKLNELGQRRYYRLPDMVMLGKKVLLLCKSRKIAQSIEKMFKYFLYDVVVGVAEYKRQGSDMSQYDILVVEDKIATEGLENLIVKVQKTTPLKYVLIQDSNYVESKDVHIKSIHLVKPVMQESIFELIISLFSDDTEARDIKFRDKQTPINMEELHNTDFNNEEKSFTEKSRKNSQDNIKQTSINMKKYIDEAFKNGEKSFVKKATERKPESTREERRNIERVILNTELGEQKSNKMNLSYPKELKQFLDRFDRSDHYFRQIVNDKQIWQIKEFCIDLEKQAKIIGAQSMSALVDRISLLFVYDKLDMLPTYTNKYHMELKKLMTEIKAYLKSL